MSASGNTGKGNYRRNPRSKPRKRKNRVLLFFLIMFSIIAVFIVIAAPMAAKYLNELNENTPGGVKKGNAVKNNEPDNSTEEQSTGFLPNLPNPFNQVKKRTNVLILGMDDDSTRSDTIMVMTFDSEDNSLGLLSVPRDTRIKIGDERLAKLKTVSKNVPSSGYTKINHITSYGGEQYGRQFVKEEVEEIIGVEIDYTVQVGLEAFRYIVDNIVGGVELTVTQPMNYNDPFQDLTINLKPGTYVMNGKQAEGFVRMREIYADRDIGRTRAQQTFMKEIIKQALQKDNIKNNIPEYIYMFMKYVKTDFGADDALKYVKFLDKLDVYNMKTATLPGRDRTYESSYWVLDEEGCKEVINDIFFTAAEKEDLVSLGKKIKIYNGSSVNGIATKMSTTLKDRGYTLLDPANYTGERANETRIVVATEGIGTDILKYFKDAVIVVDSSQLENGVEIAVIIGQSEK